MTVKIACKTKTTVFVKLLAYFVFSTAAVFLCINFSSLMNILKGNPQKTFPVDQLVLTRWTAMEAENTFCSEEDPTILFSNYDGYIQSIEINLIALEDTPECSPKMYWTNADHPAFSEKNSQEFCATKTGSGILFSVNRYVTDFRLDLYAGEGAKIWLGDIVINPRTLMFPATLFVPICIVGFLYFYMIVNSDKQKPILKTGNCTKIKIEELDFIRAVCAIGIILFHISSYVSKTAPKLMYRYANGTFGALFVGVFLLISGGVLYYNYPEVKNLSTFYYKRWKSIFPMFYITFLFFFIRNVIAEHAVFYNGDPWKLLLSVFGLDGYLNYKYPGYYIVGEWFLGAIVLLYVLYPIFVKLVNTAGWKVLFFTIPLSLWQLNTDWFEIDPTTNLIYCSTLFITGMLIFKYALYRKKWLKLASCFISLLVLFVRIPNFSIFKSMIFYVFLFFAFFAVAESVIKAQPLKNLFACIGGLSFSMFLVQNRVIGYLTTYIAVDSYSGLIKLMILAVCLSIVYAWCIRAVSQAVIKTNWFCCIEKAILSFHKEGDTNGTDHN